MKKIFTVFLIIIILFLFAMIVSLSMDIHKLEAFIGSVEDDNYIVELQEKTKELKLLQANMDDKISDVESHLDDYIKSGNVDLERIEELLNKTDGIETIHGMITSINRDKQISFNIKPVKVDDQGQYIVNKKSKAIRCSNNFTSYVISEKGLVAVKQESFLNSIENGLEDEQDLVYTFKMVKNRGVQIYEGYKK